MTTTGPILVGHDGSSDAARACTWSAAIATALGEQLIVGRAYSVGGSSSGPESAAALAACELDALATSSDRWGLAPDQLSNVVHSGRPGPALVGIARAESAALLVIGSHRRGAGGAALGRVGQHVTFRSPCPIALVREADAVGEPGPLVVGVDTDDVNLKPLSWAVSLAGALQTALHIVSVKDDRSTMAPPDQILKNLNPTSRSSVDYHHMVGNPANEILEFADRVGCSAVVIGQRRQHNLGGRLLGHVAGSILRRNTRPTIVCGHD